MLNPISFENTDEFQVTAHGKVVIISWMNVETRNAFNKKSARSLQLIIESINTDRRFHTIFLDPGFGVFCSGWDLNEIRAVRGGSADDCGLLIDQGRGCLDSISNSACYVVAISQGHVLGFGISMLCNADNVIVSEDSELALPELGIGVVPASVVGDLVAKIGSDRALQWSLRGWIDHPSALQSGLVHSVVPQNQIGPMRDQLLTHLNALPVDQIRAIISITRNMKSPGVGDAQKFGDDSAKAILGMRE